MTCGWLSFVVVVSLTAQWAIGAWWIDGVASLAIVWLLVQEGREADPRVVGKRGHVYAVPLDRQAKRVGFQIVYSSLDESARAWGFAKEALSFATVTQDEDTHGSLRLERLPTKIEA